MLVKYYVCLDFLFFHTTAICQEFLTIIENCPNRLKRRISTVTIYKVNKVCPHSTVYQSTIRVFRVEFPKYLNFIGMC
jgi:hypothetical protein